MNDRQHVAANIGLLDQFFCQFPIHILRAAANVHNAVNVILGNASLGSDQLDHPAVDVGSLAVTAGTDGNISLFVFDPYVAVLVGNVPQHGNIGNGNILGGFAVLVLNLDLRSDILVVVQYADRADAGRIRVVMEVGKRRLPVLLIQICNIPVACHALPFKADIAASFADPQSL